MDWGEFLTQSWMEKLMRFLPLFATILMLVFWIYNYYYPALA